MSARQFTQYNANGLPMQNWHNPPMTTPPPGWTDTTGQTIVAVGVVPTSLVPWKLKAQLSKMQSINGRTSLLDDASAIIASLPPTDDTVHFWLNPDPFPRNSATLWGLAQMLGFTQASLDLFFIAAGKLTIT